MARDGGVCNTCGKHYIYTAKDAGDALRRTLKTIQSKEQEPLLVIELDNETAVPKVFYKGKEITGKVRVSFDWATKDREPNSGGTKFNVEYHEVGHKDIVKKGVGLYRGKYALD